MVAIAMQAGESWHRGGFFFGGMHWVWWAIWLLTLAALLWALAGLIRERRATRQSLEESIQAEELLRRRFARGEISEADFARQLRLLHETPVPEAFPGVAGSGDPSQRAAR